MLEKCDLNIVLTYDEMLKITRIKDSLISYPSNMEYPCNTRVFCTSAVLAGFVFVKRKKNKTKKN